MKDELIKELIGSVLNEKTNVTDFRFEDKKIIYRIKGCEYYLTIEYYRFADKLFQWFLK